MLQSEELAEEYRRHRLAKTQEQQERADADSAAAKAAGRAEVAAAGVRHEASYEGAVWRVPAGELETAIERSQLAGKTPLLLDPGALRTVDIYFDYETSTIVEAKKLVLEVRASGVPIAE
eukprot:3372811-Prymnesium_polylepis.1